MSSSFEAKYNHIPLQKGAAELPLKSAYKKTQFSYKASIDFVSTNRLSGAPETLIIESLSLTGRGDGMKDEIIKFRLSAEEKAKIEERAAAANMTISEFARKALLNREVKNYENVLPLYIEIQRIGNNINQAVKLMNTYKVVNEGDALYLMREFHKIKKMVEGFIEHGDC